MGSPFFGARGDLVPSMKQSFRPFVILLLVALSFFVFFAGLKSLGWPGAYFFLAGALLSLFLARVLSLPRKLDPNGKEKGEPGSLPGEPQGQDQRDVFIPGRNFEEMLQRLGTDESMLNVILNSMGEGVLLLNQADRIVAMNPSAEKILGTDEKTAIGRHYLEVVRHPVLADLLAHSKKEGISSGEIDFLAREEKTFAVSVAAIRVDQGHLLGQIVVFSDITSMKRLMRMRTEFVANVSHELKTPLTAILGYVETLIAGAIDDKKNRGQFLKKISDQAQRLHALITDVLELSRIESGLYITSLEPVDVSEVAQQAVELLKAKWEAKEIRIQQEIPAGTRVTAHREGLFHVLENLLDNAVKYSPEKTEIRIFARPGQNGRIEFSVQDQGPGIPKEAQTRVFERFFRVDVSRSREAGGTGLGLSIVKHLVEKMDGEVSLESGEGKGSTFSVSLSSVPI
jgi:two-component system, OmpR family, phosphate regulon sensor histidine kinase PhoR